MPDQARSSRGSRGITRTPVEELVVLGENHVTGVEQWPTRKDHTRETAPAHAAGQGLVRAVRSMPAHLGVSKGNDELLKIL